MPARAQSETGAGESAPDDNTKAMYYSLYYEEYKNRNYEDALPNLKWILENAPAYPNKDDRNFERAVEVYDSLAARVDDPAQKRAYLDSALALFDTAVSALEDDGGQADEYKWTLEKGRFIQSHPNELSDLQGEIAGLYEKAYELGGDKMQPYYIQVILAEYAKQDKGRAMEFIDELKERFGDNAEIMSMVDQMGGAIFRTPQERMVFIEGQLERDPENLELTRELIEIYGQTGEREKRLALMRRLLEMEPSPDVYRQIAKVQLDEGETEEALELYQKALDMPGADFAAEDYYNMGVAYQQLGRASQARTQFREALEVNPNFGQAYIGIADLYAQAVSNCGTMERQDKAVYWLVVDYLQRARSADPNLASAANQRINTYTRYFPNAEDKFFQGWNAGDTININFGCYEWIGETTTVR